MLGEELINKQYGNLVIKYIYINENDNRIYAHCKCTCGETVELRVDNIYSGLARKSCGINGKHKKNIVGKKYGKLTLLGMYYKEEGGRKRKFGHFECECGNTLDVRLDSVIKNDNTGRKSCGCDIKHSGGRHKEDFPKNNLIGNTYGRLTVIDYVGKRKGKNEWLCKCNCGNEKEVKARGDLLKSGKVRSCGCLVKELKGPEPNPDREDAVIKKRYVELKKRIKEKGGNLTFNEFKEIEKGKCFYCGETNTITDALSGKKFELVGVDRLNYTKGYTVDNVCGCCSTCNYLKNKLDKTSFLNKVKAIHFFVFENKEYI
ncbi:MAG TPA: hypothetical protein DG753_05785 [Clostridium sp.]|nr:hypothetical protein [Clostridium sp.]